VGKIVPRNTNIIDDLFMDNFIDSLDVDLFVDNIIDAYLRIIHGEAAGNL
jgi:hypothetical protein